MVSQNAASPRRRATPHPVVAKPSASPLNQSLAPTVVESPWPVAQSTDSPPQPPPSLHAQFAACHPGIRWMYNQLRQWEPKRKSSRKQRIMKYTRREVFQRVAAVAAVLSIIDGIHGLWNPGPKGLQDFVWDHHTMYFGTDVVATDRIAWKAIDAQRLLAGLAPEESSGADKYGTWTVR